MQLHLKKEFLPCDPVLDRSSSRRSLFRVSLGLMFLAHTDVRQVFDAFMSPGSVTERLHFFVGSYTCADQVSEGGGNVEEGEDIERLEPTIEEALEMVRDGRIRDGKTIMLLQYAALHIFKG
jgi:hypothetical protein